MSIVEAMQAMSARVQALTAEVARLDANASAAIEAVSNKRVQLAVQATPPFPFLSWEEFIQAARANDEAMRALGVGLFDRTSSTDLTIQEVNERITMAGSRARVGF